MYNVESLAMVLWGLNIPYTISDNKIIVDGEDISRYSKRKLKKFLEKHLES